MNPQRLVINNSAVQSFMALSTGYFILRTKRCYVCYGTSIAIMQYIKVNFYDDIPSG